MDGYGDDSTRDFFSQPDPCSPADGFDMFSDEVRTCPGSGSVHGPRMGIEALDLNSQAEG